MPHGRRSRPTLPPLAKDQPARGARRPASGCDGRKRQGDPSRRGDHRGGRKADGAVHAPEPEKGDKRHGRHNPYEPGPLAPGRLRSCKARGGRFRLLEPRIQPRGRPEGRPLHPLPLAPGAADGRGIGPHRQQQRGGGAPCAQHPGPRQGSHHKQGRAYRDRGRLPDTGSNGAKRRTLAGGGHDQQDLHRGLRAGGQASGRASS